MINIDVFKTLISNVFIFDKRIESISDEDCPYSQKHFGNIVIKTNIYHQKLILKKLSENMA